MVRQITEAIPTRLVIEPWPDPVIERLGHDPRSTYVETFWLSVLGPSTTWLLRCLAYRLDDEPDGFDVASADLAMQLGLGGMTGGSSVFARSVDRAVKFGTMQRSGGSLFVRRRLAPLAQRHVRRLPPRLQKMHEVWDIAPRAVPASEVEALRLRARRLALTLFELGEDAPSTERQLHRWQFHPSLAWDATQWALQRHSDARAAVAASRTEGEVA